MLVVNHSPGASSSYQAIAAHIQALPSVQTVLPSGSRGGHHEASDKTWKRSALGLKNRRKLAESLGLANEAELLLMELRVCRLLWAFFCSRLCFPFHRCCWAGCCCGLGFHLR